MTWNSGPGSYDAEQALVQRENDRIMTYHTVVRDGGVWLCTRCRRVLGEFGAGMPQAAEDCVPRTWGSGAA
jgi:hypothetical protein